MQRERVSEAAAVLEKLQDEGHVMNMSVGGFYTILYSFEKFLRKELGLEKNDRIAKIRILMIRLLDIFQVAEHDNQSLFLGISDVNFTDLEDSCQYKLAERAGCKCLVSFNVDDYSLAVGGVKVYTPVDFMEVFG